MGANGQSVQYPINYSYVEWCCKLHNDNNGADKVYIIIVHKGQNRLGRQVVGYTGYWGKATMFSSMQSKAYNELDDNSVNTNVILQQAQKLMSTKTNEGYHLEDVGFPKGQIAPGQTFSKGYGSTNNNVLMGVANAVVQNQAKQQAKGAYAQQAFTNAARTVPDPRMQLVREFSVAAAESPQGFKAVEKNFSAVLDFSEHCFVTFDSTVNTGLRMTLLIPGKGQPEQVSQWFLKFEDWQVQELSMPTNGILPLFIPKIGGVTQFKGFISNSISEIYLYDTCLLRGMLLDKFEYKLRFNYAAQFVKAVNGKLDKWDILVPQFKPGTYRLDVENSVKQGHRVLSVDPESPMIHTKSGGKSPMIIYYR